MTTSHENYLHDALQELLRRARDARGQAAAPSVDAGSPNAAFAKGRAMAYYEVVSHLIGQLDVFGIDRTSVGIDPKLDLDRDLL